MFSACARIVVNEVSFFSLPDPAFFNPAFVDIAFAALSDPAFIDLFRFGFHEADRTHPTFSSSGVFLAKACAFFSDQAPLQADLALHRKSSFEFCLCVWHTTSAAHHQATWDQPEFVILIHFLVCTCLCRPIMTQIVVDFFNEQIGIFALNVHHVILVSFAIDLIAVVSLGVVVFAHARVCVDDTSRSIEIVVLSWDIFNLCIRLSLEWFLPMNTCFSSKQQMTEQDTLVPEEFHIGVWQKATGHPLVESF
mmetsp:Transcript_24033/g.54566  ORF Transcript_24033/g.54566 Transcript_24033/m.54566 type:complete len:251 (-) Transcript_24033:516-1268(-)